MKYQIDTDTKIFSKLIYHSGINNSRYSIPWCNGIDINITNMILAGIKFQLWYKSSVSLRLYFESFIHSMLCITKAIRIEIWKPDCSHCKIERSIQKKQKNKRGAWRFSKRAANITHEKLECKFKIRKWVQIKTHKHSKIDTRIDGNLICTTQVCT